MEYNTTRSDLIIPEYGRHIQQMVNHCLTITDEAERNNFAEIIIEVMGELNPHLRDVPDFQHKLWDQLYIMSDFQLDVNFPYPKPTEDIVKRKPNRIPYPAHAYKYRYYGNNIRKMIDVLVTWEEGEKKEALIMVIANHMKKCYLLWNKDTVDDRVIFNHLKELSDGKINISANEETLLSTERLQQHVGNTGNTNRRKSNSNNRTRNNRFNKK